MRINGNRTAAYMRLSREDGDKLESDSIKNQRDLIKGYIAQNRDLVFEKEYVDDGYSGTNYERPSFQRLLEDIKAGKINCIIVKDLSRLGRNYIETGRYLEKIFPFLGVRFISILDHYDSFSDSNDADQIIIPFKNLINDAYCRDISTKIRSQLDVKRKNGKFIGSFACYGYRKDMNDKNHLVIDSFAADIVRMIYRLKLQGCNSQRIADTLNEMGVLTPAEYKRSKGFHYDCGFRSGSNPRWEVVSVNRILTNEMYTGTMVQGINSKINYKVKMSRPVPREDWIRVSDTHKPIISREDFEKVQKLLTYDTRTAPEQESVYLFSGLIVCGDCGQNMVRRSARRGDRKYTYYHCSTYKSGKGCNSHLIGTEQIEKIVLDSVRTQIDLVLKADQIVQSMDRITEDQPYIRTLQKQISELDAEIKKHQDIKASAYVDMLTDLLSKEDFQDISRRHSEKLDAAKKKQTALIESKQRLLKEKIPAQPWIDTFRRCRNIEKLERSIAVALIERIIVYSKERVTVELRFQDEMQTLISLAGLAPEED